MECVINAGGINIQVVRDNVYCQDCLHDKSYPGVYAPIHECRAPENTKTTSTPICPVAHRCKTCEQLNHDNNCQFYKAMTAKQKKQKAKEA